MILGMRGRCRSCGEPVWWLDHERTGSRAPIDLEPSAEGTIEIDLSRGTWAMHVPQDELFTVPGVEISLHTSHFATCPFADRHRAPRSAVPATPRPAPRPSAPLAGSR